MAVKTGCACVSEVDETYIEIERFVWRGDNWTAHAESEECCWFAIFLQSPAVSVAGVDIREMRAGDVHAARAGHRRRRRLLVRVIQRGHPSLRQSGLSILPLTAAPTHTHTYTHKMFLRRVLQCDG